MHGAAGAVLNVLTPRAGSTLAVFGAGAVGLAAVMAAALLPLRALVAVDVQRSGLELAKSLGATHVIHAGDTDPVRALREITEGGPDHVVECSGVPEVLTQAIHALGTGGCVAVVGVPPFGQTAAVDVADLVNGGKRVHGVVEGRSNPPTFLPQLAKLVAAGQLPMGKLVATFPLEDIERAAAATNDGSVVKAVLLPSLGR
ncbi:hypothetical protein GCM10012280_69400 [Wenjunlia tyrosinilytica]|uniref:Alcohol dehydrogenase-like C-terminal domain-containing protein n=1 Tax=Wenjunlia tyrosinilytica TaxID=1544741 RepID=A0A918E1N6_9ACTN|nr:hypothetical protein GCM10012280_69400 [Wenjunlia tyrosinilytica]